MTALLLGAAVGFLISRASRAVSPGEGRPAREQRASRSPSACGPRPPARDETSELDPADADFGAHLEAGEAIAHLEQRGVFA